MMFIANVRSSNLIFLNASITGLFERLVKNSAILFKQLALIV